MQLLLLAQSNPLEHVLPHPLHIKVGPIDVTNQMFMAVVAAVLMLLIFPTLFRKAESEPPSGAKNFFESILEFLRVEVFRPALKEHTDRFLPFLWTLFFFILFCNLLGQIPFGEFITLATGQPSHWGGTATGTPTTTGALAICAFIFIHLNGIAQVARSLIDGTYGHHGHHEEHSSDGEHGHETAHDLEHVRGEGLAADVPANVKAITDPTKHYADDEHVGHHHYQPDHGDLHGQSHKHGKGMNVVAAALLALPLYLWNFAPHPFKPQPGESALGWVKDVPVWFLLLILELVGAVIKPFALMMRLFANMIAGHIVLAALIGLIVLAPSILGQIGIGIPVTLLSLLIRVLELFVAFLQAYIFTFLTTLFIASAVAPEH
ncbi:MAG TPA: F0F1 ATP synthase subunit A [Tepidisphaeraceae bacterium]|nr:F0F1 ATP synthase subunit A [Tepidisphaeraceae bacterium]